MNGNTFYFSSVKDTLEDYTTTEYLRDVAMQAGMDTEQIFIDDIGYDHDNKRFVDLDEREIAFSSNSTPGSIMLTDEFAENLLTTDDRLLLSRPGK